MFYLLSFAKLVSQVRVYQVSILPIFYEQLFHMKVFYTTFMCLQFGSVIFWQKDFCAKAAHKMLVKLTLGVYLRIMSIIKIVVCTKRERESLVKIKFCHDLNQGILEGEVSLYR